MNVCTEVKVGYGTLNLPENILVSWVEKFTVSTIKMNISAGSKHDSSFAVLMSLSEIPFPPPNQSLKPEL